jgi:DNA-binding MarR family transcriptional regulator
VELTAQGQVRCRELDAIARAANDQLLTSFSSDEITQLKSMLQRLAGNASKHSQG